MRLLDLTIKNIRGLPNLHLPLDGKSVVIQGPNGAGKSCVVDAIEFLFTGKISRLAGEGTAGITLARHGPHIDHDAETAIVTATVQLEELDQPIEITRCIAKPDTLECPEEAKDILATISDLVNRGGVVLTRRDILRYIAAEAGVRAKEIQALLHLERIEGIRKSLRSAKSELARKKKSAQHAVNTAKEEVNVTLGLPKYDDEGLARFVNDSRKTLNGEPIKTLKSDEFKLGIAPPNGQRAGQHSANLNHIQQMIRNIRSVTRADQQKSLKRNDEELRQQIGELNAKPQLLAELAQLELTTRAMSFVEQSTIVCPVCGAKWHEGYLASHLQAKEANAQAAKSAKDRLTKAVEALISPGQRLRANLEALIDAVTSTPLKKEHEVSLALESWRNSIDRLLKALDDPIALYFDAGFPTMTVSRLLAPVGISQIIDNLEQSAGDAIPIPTREQTAWDTLTTLQESVRALENRTRDGVVVGLFSSRADVLLTAYEEMRDSVLQDLYSRISDRFVEFYAVLHDHERNHFDARLEPHKAALSFEVDFMGRGSHPPHALHSEGHQDSMGVCLFLALNEELSQSNLQLIVLDDVMMSVDTGHRKDVCRLLNAKFPNHQFVITTHDRTWAMQLKQQRVVDSDRVIEFTGWTVEGGPHAHQQIDLWEAIQKDIDNEKIPEAAFKLRRGNEEFFESVCDALGAELIYNSGMQWQLDDFLPAAMNQYKSLLKEYRSAAFSWNNTESVAQVEEQDSIRKQIFGRTYVEQWAINSAVHFNNWENLSKEDFQPVTDAFRDLHGLFLCSNCGGLLEKTPRKGSSQTVSCPCSKVYWNLRKKAKTD